LRVSTYVCMYMYVCTYLRYLLTRLYVCVCVYIYIYAYTAYVYVCLDKTQFYLVLINCRLLKDRLVFRYPVPVVQEAGPRTSLDGCVTSGPHWDSIPQTVQPTASRCSELQNVWSVTCLSTWGNYLFRLCQVPPAAWSCKQNVSPRYVQLVAGPSFCNDITI
jgi:hypothetical protein